MLDGVPERQDTSPIGSLNSGENVQRRSNRNTPRHVGMQHRFPGSAFIVDEVAFQFDSDSFNERSSIGHSRFSRAPSKGNGIVRHKHRLVNADKGTALGNFSLARKAIRANTGRAA